MTTRKTTVDDNPILEQHARAIRKACDAYYREASKTDGVHLQMLRAYGQPDDDDGAICLALILPNDQESEEVLDTLSQAVKRVLEVMREWVILQEAFSCDNRGR